MRQISLGNLGLQSQQRQVHEGSKYVPSSSFDFSKNLELKVLLLSWYLALLLMANSNIFQHCKQHLSSSQ